MQRILGDGAPGLQSQVQVLTASASACLQPNSPATAQSILLPVAI